MIRLYYTPRIYHNFFETVRHKYEKKLNQGRGRETRYICTSNGTEKHQTSPKQYILGTGNTSVSPATVPPLPPPSLLELSSFILPLVRVPGAGYFATHLSDKDYLEILTFKIQY